MKGKGKRITQTLSVVVCLCLVGAVAATTTSHASWAETVKSAEAASQQDESVTETDAKETDKDMSKKTSKTEKNMDKDTDKDTKEKSSDSKEDKEETPSKKTEDKAGMDSGKGSSSNSNSGNSSTSTGSSGSSITPAKVWHDPVYQQVYVVDQAAWTETVSEPVYNTVCRSICNNCGADITGDPDAHMEPSLLSGGNCGGYHSEYYTIQTGTNTYNIYHEEIGHYETVLVQDGYWE